MSRTLIFGTRGSHLALTQTRQAMDAVRAAHPSLRVEERIIRTTGDEQTTKPLPEIGGKGLFTLELENALVSGDIDAAVHSLKDLPTELPDGLTLGATPKRATPFDALISKNGETLDKLPDGALVGSSSRRRAAQLRAIRPDLRVESIRGNLDTRIRKLRDDEWDAIVVAAAGLDRIGRLDEASQILTPDEMLPAVGQGALGIELRADDDETQRLLMAIHDEPTSTAVRAERAFLRALGGGCHVPIAAYGVIVGDRIELQGLVAGVDGKRIVKSRRSGVDPESLGRQLATELIDAGARELLEGLG
ncbi:MAG: hydroxymethylbilane synthase [Candidatus Poribacteria bacterium]|nr:hydroxymethylbilane synthase [Candidatus Poribacteria bacterium]